MKHSFIYIILLFLLNVCCVDNVKQKTKNNITLVDSTSYEETISLIQKISKRYESFNYKVEWPSTLYESQEFKEIIEHPEKYKSHLTRIITDQNSTHLFKEISVYGLQHLCIDDYLSVIKNVYTQYKKGIINKGLLYSSISQQSMSIEVIKNYENQNLRHILVEIREYEKDNNAELSDIDFLESIISGQCWKENKKYCEENNEKLPWTCK